MKTITACISLIALLCVTNAYCVENKYVEGTYYQNARVKKSQQKKLKDFVDSLLAKTTDYTRGDPLYKFTSRECAEYFLDLLGKKKSIFDDSKFMGKYTIKGYSVSVNDYGRYMYEIISDFKSEATIDPTINLFNIDTDNIPPQARVHTKDDKNAYFHYVSTPGTQGSSVAISDICGIDIDKNGIEDVVILSEYTDKREHPGQTLTIVMNETSNPTIIKAGTEAFQYMVDEFNVIFHVSFIDYNDKEPVLLSIGAGVDGSGYAGMTLYYYEKGQFKPLFSDFSWSN